MARNIASIDQENLFHHYTNLEAHKTVGPFIIAGGDGIHIIDDKGNKYIEGMAGLWCTSLGFSEQRLTAAATKQMQEMPYAHLFAHQANIPSIELAEKLIAHAPEGIGKAFFVNSGSEAVDAAIKMVWYYNNARGMKKKKTIISRRRGYHGVTIAAGSLTALPYVQDGFDLPAISVLHVETPHAYRNAKPGESDTEFSTRLAEELEATILEAGADTIGAFIAEPVMGAGGVLVPPEGYFDKVQKVLQKHDILFIADEVICGFGRTGQWWGSDTYGIKPDIMTSAKQLSSAYIPIGAVLVSDRVYDTVAAYSNELGMFGTGNTYGGHPVAAAVALETLKIYEERNIVEHVQQRSVHFAERIQALLNHPLVGNARCVGLIGAIEIVKDKSSREQFPVADKVAVQISKAAKKHGLIVRPTPGDSIAFCPPLIINDDQIDDMFDSVNNALNETLAAIS